MKTFQLTCDQVDAIIIEDLKNCLLMFKQDYNQVGGIRVFVNDIEEDRKLIKKRIKALKMILDWYGEKCD